MVARKNKPSLNIGSWAGLKRVRDLLENRGARSSSGMSPLLERRSDQIMRWARRVRSSAAGRMSMMRISMTLGQSAGAYSNQLRGKRWPPRRAQELALELWGVETIGPDPAGFINDDA